MVVPVVGDALRHAGVLAVPPVGAEHAAVVGGQDVPGHIRIVIGIVIVGFRQVDLRDPVRRIGELRDLGRAGIVPERIGRVVEIVGLVDEHGEGERLDAVALARLEGHRRADVGQGHPRLLQDVLGAGAGFALGRIHRRHRGDRDAGGDHELSVGGHRGAGRIDADGAEVAAQGGHRVAHRHAPGGAEVVVLAVGDRVVHRLRACGSGQGQQGRCKEYLFHFHHRFKGYTVRVKGPSQGSG